ncbi:MAG: glycosyltransferase family 4 protein [Deltaproteobacteria bacterium]|nr:glycosyltransferase family 4 protein [Deltaproteobacteria bacterium]
MNKKNPAILFTTQELRYPATGGPYLRIENSVKALNAISELYLYSRVTPENMGGDRAVEYYEKLCKKFFMAPSCKRHKLHRTVVGGINIVGRKALGKNILQHYESKMDFDDLLRTADSVQADVIWLGFGNISYPLMKYIKENSAYRVVVDTDSVWSRFLLRGLAYHVDKDVREKTETAGRAKEKEEAEWTNLADITTAVSDVDKEYYQGLTERKDKVMLFSNVIDMANYTGRHENPGIQRPSVYLAGSFGKNSPMEEAARWTIEKVMPLVWKDIPQVRFYILGNGSCETLADVKDERITIAGRVESVLPYLCNVDIALVPLKFESGTRFKILEAGACKVPVVSTTLGAEGLNVTHGKDILIADTPEEFAAATIELLTDKAKAAAIGAECYKLVNDNYAIGRAREEAMMVLERLGFE